jgi:hypothetical protein
VPVRGRDQDVGTRPRGLQREAPVGRRRRAGGLAAPPVDHLAAMFAGAPEEELRVIGESFARYNQAVARHYGVSLLPD